MSARHLRRILAAATAFTLAVAPAAQACTGIKLTNTDGTTVHGDVSGEWTLDENGDLEDIAFFASPRSMGSGRKAR